MPGLGTAIIHSRVLFPQGNLLGLTAFSLSCLSVRLNKNNKGNSDSLRTKLRYTGLA